jgi:GMP synthase PP-ATPase subunit
MSKTTEAHKKAVKASITSTVARERFLQAMTALKKNLDGIPTAEAKVAAIEDTFAHHLDEIANDIFHD